MQINSWVTRMLVWYTTRSRGNEAYLLRMDYGSVPVYCHMTSSDIGACGGGGWSLAMKIDGDKVIYLLWMAIGSICVSFTKSKLLLMKKRHLSATEKVK